MYQIKLGLRDTEYRQYSHIKSVSRYIELSAYTLFRFLKLRRR